MIEVYNDCKDKEEETLPQPKLKLQIEGSKKELQIIAVDDNGKRLAYIWSCSKFTSDAKNAIIANKHSTDWANWNDDASFKSLK